MLVPEHVSFHFFYVVMLPLRFCLGGIEPVSLLSPESADGLFTSSATWEAHVCAQMPWVSWQALSLTDRRLGAGGSEG